MDASTSDLPLGDRDVDSVAGHWLLARLGKRVLRPGGVELTRRLLDEASPADADVVELAPGLGRTAEMIQTAGPRSYVGIEADPAAARATRAVVEPSGSVREGEAADTGLPDASAGLVVGEAILSLQGQAAKATIVAEAARILRPGGRYAIHELCLVPDATPDAVKTELRRDLARTIRVNARPLTAREWRDLLTDHGLVVDRVDTAPMALLEPRRLVSDEGLLGALRFARNLALRPRARRRVLAMRATFRAHRDHLAAIAVVAHRPDQSKSEPDPAPG